MHAGIVFSIHSLIPDCSLLARVLQPIGVVDRIFQTLVSKNSKTEPWKPRCNKAIQDRVVYIAVKFKTTLHHNERLLKQAVCKTDAYVHWPFNQMTLTLEIECDKAIQDIFCN